MYPHKGTLLKEHLDEFGIYEYVYRNYPDPIYVLDTTGNFLEANSNISSLTGYSFDEFVQLSFKDLL